MANRNLPEPTEEDCRTVERMAGRGATLDDIAYCLGWSPATLDRRKVKYPQIETAYAKGRAIAKDAMAQRLWEIAHSDDERGQPTKSAVIATIFWLKCQGGWKEQPDTIEASTPQVQIYLPKREKQDG